MRAPLGSMQQYIELLTKLSLKPENKKKIKHFLKMIQF